jgi:hypothetical protein
MGVVIGKVMGVLCERETEKLRERVGVTGRERNFDFEAGQIFRDRIRATIRASDLFSFNHLNVIIFRTNLILIFLSYQIN